MTNGMANGKKAHEDGDIGAEARTIFVRNLPYSFTEIQLLEVFSEIGPVRRSFIINQKGSDQHRGFGYVQFAIPEDALRAVKDKDGAVLQGRKIMAKIARRRPSFEARCIKQQTGNESDKAKDESFDYQGLEKKAATSEKKQELIQAKFKRNGETIPKKQAFQDGPVSIGLSRRGEADQPKQASQEPGGEKKKKKKKKEKDVSVLYPNNIEEKMLKKEESSKKQRVARTVILGGLTSPEMCESAMERAKRVGPVESIQSSWSPQELKGRGLEKDGCKMGAAAVVFKSVKVACQCVAELHQKFIGSGIVWARQLGGEGAKPRKWRVIIRNLPFHITEETVRELFASCGFVWEVKIPRKDGQARGFAFASFISKASAEKAIHDTNGKIVQKRTIAVDWAVERKAYQASTSVNLDGEEILQSDPKDDETASESEEDVKQETSFFRDLEDECGEIELLASSEEADLARKVLYKVVSTSTADSENAELRHLDVDKDGHRVSCEKLKMSQSEIKATDDKLDTQTTSQRDLKKTIFIKNLPFDADEATVKKLFSTFGKVKSMYLVRHPKTKRPKGSAFLQFVNEESVEGACAAASGSGVNKDYVAGISHGGRKLEVLQALEKTSIATLEKEKLEQRMVDRRNLYLLREGKIQDGLPAANGVSEQDMQKRRELEQVKKVKLKSPIFHVSKTRLAVHNLPKSLNELGLRKLFTDAVKLRATKQEPVIKQAKIVRDQAKGNKKSRGFAFVEFTEHEHALVALRVLNNNPETFGPERRPIVEFAIENVQLLGKRQEQLSARSKQGTEDSTGKFEPKAQQNGNSRPDFRQKGNEEKRKLLKRKDDGLTSKAHGGPGTDMKILSRSKKRLKPGLQEFSTSNLKRKREHSVSKEGVGNDSFANVKMQKLSTGSIRRKELQGSNNKPLSVNSNGSKQKAIKAESLVKNLHSSSTTPRMLNKSKLAKKTKGPKAEIEDKLDKMVAEYREKYFTNKEQKRSTGVTASTEFKRWFE